MEAVSLLNVKADTDRKRAITPRDVIFLKLLICFQKWKSINVKRHGKSKTRVSLLNRVLSVWAFKADTDRTQLHNATRFVCFQK